MSDRSPARSPKGCDPHPTAFFSTITLDLLPKLRSLAAHAMSVYMVLDAHCFNDARRCMPSQKRIARIIGCGDNPTTSQMRDVNRSVRKLVDAGFVVIDKQGGGFAGATVYHLPLARIPSKDAGRRDSEKRIEENRLSYSADYPKKPEVTEAQLAEFIATAPESYRSLAQDIQGFKPGSLASLPASLPFISKLDRWKREDPEHTPYIESLRHLVHDALQVAS